MSSRISKNHFVSYRMAKILAKDSEELVELSGLEKEKIKDIERRYNELRKRYRTLFT